MARWFLLAGAAGVLGVGLYFFATDQSRALGGGTVAAALLLAAAAAATWPRTKPHNTQHAEPGAAPDRGGR